MSGVAVYKITPTGGEFQYHAAFARDVSLSGLGNDKAMATVRWTVPPNKPGIHRLQLSSDTGLMLWVQYVPSTNTTQDVTGSFIVDLTKSRKMRVEQDFTPDPEPEPDPYLASLPERSIVLDSTGTVYRKGYDDPDDDDPDWCCMEHVEGCDCQPTPPVQLLWQP